MKSFMALSGTALVAVLAASSPVQAENTSDSFVIQGSLGSTCFLENKSVGEVAQVELDKLAPQILGQFEYTCNAPAGFTRTISSQNAGYLENGNNQIRYLLGSGGGNFLGFQPVHLESPVNTNVPFAQPFTNGFPANIIFQLDVLPQGVSAGDYTDTVNVAIAAN